MGKGVGRHGCVLFCRGGGVVMCSCSSIVNAKAQAPFHGAALGNLRCGWGVSCNACPSVESSATMHRVS